MGLLMQFVITPPVAGINEWLIDTLKGMDTSSRIMVGLIMGGMMSVDMGGPVNKAAYVTGTGLLAGGEFGVMAAVMAGGMVPPIAIALLKASANLVLLPLLWACPSSLRVQFHLLPQIQLE